MILSSVLLQKDVEIYPFYCCKSLPSKTVFNEGELDVMEKYGAPDIWYRIRPNVDLGLLGVNKSFRKTCSAIYYSSHTFIFNDARSCFWFFKRIGRENLRNLNDAVFNISSGYFLSMKNRTRLDICEEQLWCQAFDYLRRDHGLKNCTFRFYELNDLSRREDLSDDDKSEMTRGRLNLVSLLCTFRGLTKVRIENDKCEFLGYGERAEMAEMMVLLGPVSFPEELYLDIGKLK